MFTVVTLILNLGQINLIRKLYTMFKKALLICLLLFSLSTTILFVAKANPAVIRVPGDYANLQEAIDNASPGDTVMVSRGTYYGSLFIDKNLTLTGEDKYATILDGNGQDIVVLANLTSVIISGFTIINGTQGIVLESCTGSTVKENRINGFTIGIWLHYSNSNIVSDNIVTTSGWCGILLCGGSSENNVTSNTLKDNANGIGLTGTNNTIYHNNFIANQNQTQMYSSHRNIWNNSYEGNYWSDYNGTEFNNYGIGSSPYTIDPDNIDGYPLKNAYMIGDVNHDAKINIMDISFIAKAFWTMPGEERWNPYADITEDSQINITDIAKAAKNFGKEWTIP